MRRLYHIPVSGFARIWARQWKIDENVFGLIINILSAYKGVCGQMLLASIQAQFSLPFGGA